MADVYWTSRHKLFKKEEGDEGDANIKEATKNYATAWSIFAALLMTVSFSLIPADTGAFYDDNDEDVARVMTYIYIALLLISTVFSFLAVLVGTFRYTYFDGIPGPMVGDAINSMALPGSELFVYPAMITQMLASVVSCYLFMGVGMLIMAIIIFLIVFIPGFIFVAYRYRTSVDGIDGLQLGATANLGQKSKRDITENTDVIEEANK